MWNLRSQERLSVWRQLRLGYDSMEFEHALLEVTRLWSYAPYVNHYLDYQTPHDWPDPWALLAENYYCDLAKSLGMLYTLYLTQHRKDHTYAMRIMASPDSKDIYNLVWVDDGKYVLNFCFSEIVNTQRLKEGLVELAFYTDQDLKLERFI